MEVQFGPNAVDEPNLLYKLQRKIKVFNTSHTLPNRGYNLVTSSSKYGIVFVGVPDGTLSVYHLKDLVDKECEPQHFSIKLSETPTHISVSCDDELLAVTGGQLLHVYKVSDFQNVNVSPAVTIQLDTNPSAFVSALQWNPCIPDNIALAFFDGTLLVASVASNQVKKVQQNARCICWSPKGKQLVTGNSDGSLCQYKPDLTLAKKVPPPNLFEGAPVEALAIYWISTYQFAVVFRNASNDSRPAVTIVNTPKAGQATCINYEDICYSMGTNRPWFYYLQGIAQWNMILASSSNSMEIGTLGSVDGSNWLQWSQSDEARPELPLTDKKIENYPVGICIDTCALYQLPWGENETLPYMPLLLVVSQSGLLTLFNVINLNQQSPQVCNAPQQQQLISLPAAALTSDIPDDAPAQVTLPAPPSAAPPSKPQAQPIPQPQPTQTPQAFSAPSSGFGSMLSGQPFGTTGQAFGAKPFTVPPQPTQSSAAPIAQAPEPKQQETKPLAAASTPKVSVQEQTKTALAKPQVAPEVSAALKAEQEKVNKKKMEQELKNMLVKEVNDFQAELYKFVVKTRDVQNKLQQELNSIESVSSPVAVDCAELRRHCDAEQLRAAVVQLKLELVRACAVLAEARTHAEAKDTHQWTQVDPLTMKRVASVKKLAYYVQTQLEQAHKALDYKWNEISARDPQFNKPGQFMIRPILDDVYQPLVKQQEVLSRQQAVLRTLRNTLNECGDATPMFKSTSLLRSTPFRTKDPLSKLTKNILNMSIESQTKTAKDNLLTPQKLDALRDMLSNHKPTKIKPVNVELRHHLAQMKINYEKSIKEKAVQDNIQVFSSEERSMVPKPPTMVEKSAVAYAPAPQKELIIKPLPQVSIPSFTPVSNGQKPTMPGFSNVARTLFTDEDKPAQPVPKPAIPFQSQQTAQPVPQNKPMFGFGAPTTVANASTFDTKSYLRDMLLSKQANNEQKSDANTFMGQKICSPSAFSSPNQSSATAASTGFTSKPISDMSNMFNKFTSPPTGIPKTKSEETGEPEPTIFTKPEQKEDSKPMFQVKFPSNNAGNIPDLVQTNSQVPVKSEKVAPKPDKVAEKPKENVPEKSNENVAPQKPAEPEKKERTQSVPFGVSSNKSVPIFESTASPPVTTSVAATPSEPPKSSEVDTKVKDTKPKKESKPKEETKPKDESKLKEESNSKSDAKPETPKVEKSEAQPPSPSASSLFAAANAASPTVAKSQPFFGAPTSTDQSAISTTASQVKSTVTTTKEALEAFSSPSSIFASAAAKSNTTNETPASPTSSSASSLFASAAAKTTQSGSIFSSPSSPSQGSIFGTTTSPQSVFSSAETKPAGFSTSIFGSTAATSSPAFGSTATTSQSGIFGSSAVFATTLTSSAPSVFGSTTTAQSVFGTAAANTAQTFGSPDSDFGPTTSTAFATNQSGFGTAKATTTQSLFGATTTTTPSVFGSAASSSIFGSTAPTSQASAFGSPTTTAQSVFGTPTTQSSIFGSPTTTQSSIFGTAATSQPSLFGGGAQSGSVFGTPTTPTSVFGTVTSTQASVFGTPTQTTQASVFGSPPATTAGGSIFGGTENLFAAASISSTSDASPASGGSIFGGGGSSGSVFGGAASGTNVFGGKSTFSQSNPQAAAIFGGGTAFGQKPANNFWSGGNAGATNTFGSSGFGQQAATQSSSIFGSTTGGSFSSPSGGQAFGSPQQTSVFGSPQQQTSPGFGSSQVFGAKPAFGQPAAFGSPTSGGGFGSFGFNKSPGAAFGGGATFGGSATFGSTSPGKVFGGAAPAPSFASTQSNSTFESLATQNTLTFGNLAQQSTAPSPPAPTFNTSPSFSGWRG